MPLAPCPICKRPVAPRAQNPSVPFCSPRCRAVDLGRWLGGEYRLPERQVDEREDELPGSATQGGPGELD